MLLLGLMCGLVAALSWTFANATIQAASQRFGSVGAVVWAQLLGAPLVMLAAMAFEGLPGTPDGTGITAIVVAGGAACVAYLGLFGALKHGQLSVVIPINASWAAISVAVAAVGLGEDLTVLRGFGVALVVAGNAVLATSVRRSDGPRGTSGRALALAALSAVGFGLMVPATEVAGAQVGRLWVVPMVWAVELAIAIPFSWRRRLLGAPPESLRALWIAARVGVFEGVGFVAVSVGVGLAPISVVSPVASLSTGLSVLWGVVLLRERLHRRALAGAILASVGVVAVGL